MDIQETLFIDNEEVRAGLFSDPSFLVGAKRSGTTAVRLMLDHHPSVD